jgi:phosphohistidine phosphatase SixA
MMKNTFIEKVVRINPDIIYVSEFARAQETAKKVVEIIKEYI